MLEIQLGVSEIMIFVQGHGLFCSPVRVADGGGGGGGVFMPPEQLRKWDDSYLGFSFSLSFFFLSF